MAKLSDIILIDAESARPTAGIAGRLFFNTDTGNWERDSGSAWVVCVDSGASGTSGFAAGSVTAASGAYASAPGGRNTVASGDYSLATGREATANNTGQIAHAAGKFAANGDAQKSEFVLRGATTNATPTELFLDGASARLTLIGGTVNTFKILVSCTNDGATVAAAYELTGAIKQIGGTSTIVGTVIKTVIYETDAGLDVSATASGANGRLLITATGKAATAMRWQAVVTMAQVGFLA